MKKGNRNFLLISIAIGLFSASFGLFLYLWSPPFLREVNLRYSDFRFKIRGNIKPNPQIAIVAIDEKSINELGRWPWSRRIIARLVEKLVDYEPKVIAFDIVFSERDTDESDRALGEALEKSDNSILGYFFRNDSTSQPFSSSLEQIKRSNIKLVKSISEPKAKFLSEFRSADLNLPEIGEYARGFGFFNMLPDDDGIYRRAQLLIEYNNEIYPSLNLESMRHYLEGEILLSVASYGVEGLNVKELQIPTDERGQFLLNYYGAGGLIPTYSVLDVLSGKVARDALKGKVVFIGATEIGIYDVRPTPFDPLFSGVEIHATIAGNILDGRFLIQNNLTKGLDIVIILILPLVLVLFLMRVGGTLSGLIVFLVLIIIHLLGNYLLFARSNLLLSALYPGLSLGFAYVLFEGYRNLVIERRSRYLRKAFSSYVSPAVVAEILRDPDKLKLGGENREITVLFSDIRGFTSISERMSPEALVSLLNEYLSPMTQIVMEEFGTLDKYVGDAIMAVFGAPLDVPDHSKRACLAALTMMEKLEMLNTEWKDRGLPRMSIGIGINTGEAIVGNMGANVRFEYTAIGDTVNLASRLEGLNKLYGTGIIVTKLTLDNIGSNEPPFLVRELDLVRVKGKEKPVPIYELIGLNENNSEMGKLAALFNEALEIYRKGEFTLATESFKEILKMFPGDKPTELYLDRCSHFIVEPPPVDWDGVYIAKEK